VSDPTIDWSSPVMVQDAILATLTLAGRPMQPGELATRIGARGPKFSAMKRELRKLRLAGDVEYVRGNPVGWRAVEVTS
jgi:hypothetical protein